MWGDHIHLKNFKIEPVIIPFERSSKKFFCKFANLSNIVTRTILVFFLTLSYFNVDLGFKPSSEKYFCKFCNLSNIVTRTILIFFLTML